MSLRGPEELSCTTSLCPSHWPAGLETGSATQCHRLSKPVINAGEGQWAAGIMRERPSVREATDTKPRDQGQKSLGTARGRLFAECGGSDSSPALAEPLLTKAARSAQGRRGRSDPSLFPLWEDNVLRSRRDEERLSRPAMTQEHAEQRLLATNLRPSSPGLCKGHAGAD